MYDCAIFDFYLMCFCLLICQITFIYQFMFLRTWRFFDTTVLKYFSRCIFVCLCLEPVSECIFLGSKITADGDCSHEIKRRLLLGRKVMTNLDSIFKNKDITLPTKVRLIKAMVFPVVMYGCESWTVKKAEHRRIDAFELW